MTNYEVLKGLNIRRFAELLINVEWQNNTGSNLYYTSDNREFTSRNRAVEHEIEWLNREYK